MASVYSALTRVLFILSSPTRNASLIRTSQLNFPLPTKTVNVWRLRVAFWRFPSQARHQRDVVLLVRLTIAATTF